MPTFTVTLTQQELAALSGLLDAGVRGLGLRAVKDAAVLLTKLEALQPDQPADEQQDEVEPA